MISSSIRMTSVAACAALCALPAAAPAATLSGTVVGQPKTAHGRVVVPVLLSAAGARAAGGPVAKVSVPKAHGIRTKVKTISAGDLRIGDRVRTAVTHITTHERAVVLRVSRRGAALPFSRLSRSRSATATSVAQAIGAVDQLKANPMTLLNPATPATSNAALRAQLSEVRAGLNSLIADMRVSADGIDAAVATIERARPIVPARRAAVAAQQKALLDGLTQAAAASRDAADQLEANVTKLDEAINAIGGASSPSIGINEVGTVSDVLHAVLELLRGL